jgi:hypothetical protein
MARGVTVRDESNGRFRTARSERSSSPSSPLTSEQWPDTRGFEFDRVARHQRNNVSNQPRHLYLLRNSASQPIQGDGRYAHRPAPSALMRTCWALSTACLGRWALIAGTLAER